ncbi:protein phyllopod [Musca vetustissima]|uniref:protein phyllopod n=1 Tax=Musca vetustissima TaxID=27455 RepID=UPI002AB6111F|nr:protein phyllopod [Musca vetustissima]
MSENSSEYLKRTCLICGCHTNQTINIYEPRSGPNIVQLIQAKFKFQPLNEDKYLCFSCNNWLINWHSLQALNSNDAESPSGTFRSHLNSGNVMQDEKSSGSKKKIAVCRPIARVSPQQQPQPMAEQSPSPVVTTSHSSVEAQDVTMENVEVVNEPEPEDLDLKPNHKINFNKRNFRVQLARRGHSQHKNMLMCSCGKYIVIRSSSTKFFKVKASAAQPKCRQCRDLTRMRASYMRSIVQVEQELAIREAPLYAAEGQYAPAAEVAEQPQQNQQQSQQRLHLPKPTVDGKVVAMLRRLGTHLSRESDNGNGCSDTTVERLPQIMSPTKPKSPKWLRPLEDDEILLNFDTSISEVLPSLADQFTHVNSLAARKKLSFEASQITEVIDLCEAEDTNDDSHSQGLQQLDCADLVNGFNLPKGLSITLA